MSTPPTQAQVDIVGGSDGASSTTLLGESDNNGTFTKTYSRVYEHYISNNMSAAGYTETAVLGIVTRWALDEGWHLIPYWNPGVSMTAQEAATIPIISQAVRVKSLGFTVKHAQMFRTDKQVLGGTTVLSNTFCDNPYAELFKDNRHEFDYLLQPLNAGQDYVPYGVVVPYPNNSMKYNEVTSVNEGTLARVKWQWNQRPAAATPDTYETRLMQQGGEGPWAAISTLNHGARLKLGLPDLSQYSYTWKNKNNGWHPHALPQGSIMGTRAKAEDALVPFIWPNSRSVMLTGVTPFAGSTGFTRGILVPNNKYAHWQKFDMQSCVESADNNQPVDHYIKLQRLLDPEGPMNLSAKLVIEYHCTLEFQPRSNLFAHPQLQLTAPTTVGQFENFSTNNFTCSGRLRDFEPYGISAYSATQPSSASASRYQIYQPASVSEGNKRASGDVEEGECSTKKARIED